MWRRLCLDVSENDGLIGASVEWHDSDTGGLIGYTVLSSGWVRDHDLAGALVALLNDLRATDDHPVQVPFPFLDDF